MLCIDVGPMMNVTMPGDEGTQLEMSLKIASQIVAQKVHKICYMIHAYFVNFCTLIFTCTVHVHVHYINCMYMYNVRVCSTCSKQVNFNIMQEIS